MSEKDTIVAVATPPGQGGVGIVRVSGNNVDSIANALLGSLPRPRYAHYGPFLDDNGQPIDHGIALLFRAPHSFTGEDVLELHGHGGPMVLDLLLQRVISLGVRAARAGEFSERAFLNDKIDLAQAEAIADLIAAQSHEAAKAAMHSLEGRFSAEIHGLVEQLIQLRVHVESALDFPEEEVDFLADSDIADRLRQTQTKLGEVKQSARQGRLLKEGMRVVIAGRPNAGKSSLLNQLAGQDTAIVTDIPGTTRDILREHIQLDGLPLHIIDTAGLRESDDVVEREGIRRAMNEIEQADRLLYIMDINQGADEERVLALLPENTGITFVMNKIDLCGQAPRIVEQTDRTEIYLSARTGQGIELLRDHLKQCIGYERHGEGKYIARRRHLEAIAQAEQCLARASVNLHEHRAGELVAEELQQAQNRLSTITGEFSSDDLLGRIFADFCIGK